MADTIPTQQDQIVACLRTLRETVDKLQELLGAPAEDTLERFYRRRRELLARIFAAGGLDQAALFRLLDEHQTPHQWIGQQVKSGYMDKMPRPSSQDLYVATRKAVQELQLQEEAQAMTALTEETLAADWEAPEDAAYDRL
jgi:hypothetical protein